MIFLKNNEQRTGFKRSQVAYLVNLIDYQEDAIVSRTIIDNESGTVTLFSFDKGQGLSEHTTPYEALMYLIDGEVSVTLSGKTYHLQQGEMIVMPPNEPHALKALSRFKMLLILIHS